MNISFVTQEYPPETAHGGIGTQAHAKAHGLADRGHKVWVISHSRDAERHEYWQGKVRVVRIPGFDQRMPLATEEARWLTYSMMVAAEVERLRTRDRLDLVEFPDWGCESYVHLLNRVSWNHLPTVIHLHGPLVMLAHALGWPEPSSRFFRVAQEMERTSLHLADEIISSSHCSARWVAEHYGLTLGDIPILHTGIDTQLFQPRPVPKASRPTIIFVGKIERTKGIDALVEAACKLACEVPNLHLRLVGRGNPVLAQSLRQMAGDAGFPDLIELVGFVPREELPDHLSRAHVFAGPSVYEGGPGFVYLEAMACGLPVIACSGSGASEAVRDGLTGVLVPPKNIDALQNALRRLLNNPDECTRMGKQARDAVCADSDSESCLGNLAAFYERVVLSAKGPSVKC